MIVDLNGMLTHAAAARIDPADRGFLLGDAIFESLRVRGGRAEFLAEHLTRLEEASRVTGIPLPFDLVNIEGRIASLAEVNNLMEGALRLTVSRGPASRGVAPPMDCVPTVLLAIHPLPPTRNDAVSAVIATATRRNEFSPFSRVKATPYLDSIVALKEARENGAQDAILLNTAGRVASAAFANLFAVVGGRLVTPPSADGPLAGITRGRLLAQLDGVPESLTPDDLAAAGEIFLTNSFGIRPVIALDGRALPIGAFARMAQEIVG